MDKNKGHIDAKEFFRLLDANTREQHRDLDEFDLEALEGFQLVKDPANAKEIADSNIDKKLEELIAEEKEERPLSVIGTEPEKKRSRTGLYMMSMAASLVLLLGLFFMFKGLNKEANMAENKTTAAGTTADQAPPPPALEEKLKETSSDEKIMPEKGPAYKAGESSPVPLEEAVTENEAQYFANTQADTAVAQAEVTELAMKSVVENKNVDNTKSIEQKYRAENIKGKADDSNTDLEAKKESGKKMDATVDGTTADQFVTFEKSNLKDKREEEKDKKEKEANKVKSRGVVKKQTSNEGYVAGAPPSMNDQKVPAQMLDSIKSEVAANGTLTPNPSGPNTLTTTSNTPTYTWTGSATGTTKPAKAAEAEFTGGKTALDAYIKKNLKVPESLGSEEVIVVKFLIDAKGAISKVKIMSKTGNCSDCEKEAVRFVKAMQGWIPPTQDGKEVMSYKTLALSFKK